MKGGNYRFWWDDWLGVGPIALHNKYIPRIDNSLVLDFLVDGLWNEEKVRQHSLSSLVHKILNTVFTYQEGVADWAIWKLKSSGIFSCSSAWILVREKKSTSWSVSLIWHKHIPFKTSFLLWRALRCKLPTNDKIVTFGHEPVACSCCYRPGFDTVENILVTGNFTTHFRGIFFSFLGHLA